MSTRLDTLTRTELIGQVTDGTPCPLFLVDERGRSHPLNAPARRVDLAEHHDQAFVSPVSFSDGRNASMVGYCDGTDTSPALVSAVVVLLADLLGQGPCKLDDPVLERDLSDLEARADRDELEEWRLRLAAAKSAAELAVLLVPALHATTDCGAAHLFLAERDDAELAPVGSDAAESGVGAVLASTGWIGWALEQDGPSMLRSFHHLPETLQGELHGCALESWFDVPLALVPLRSAGELLGFVYLGGLRRGAADQTRQRLATLQPLFDQVAAGLAGLRLQREARTARRLEHELDIARRLQTRLVPDLHRKGTGYEVAGSSRSAAQVGGDGFGLRIDDAGRPSLSVFDVAGHGIGAALGMGLVRSILKRELEADDQPGLALRETNRRTHEDLAGSGLFATAALLRLDPEKNRLEIASAGHPPMVHWSARDRRFQEDHVGGLPLGLEASAGFPELVTDFGPGDLVVLHTDGVLEAENADGERFGRHRLLGALHRLRRKDARQVLRGLWRELATFTGDRPLRDDATLVVLRGERVSSDPSTADSRKANQ
ncbi:MAG: GAF domain-containing SpoIIE family protein phosphatase [Acidobacteriota bacterium]